MYYMTHAVLILIMYLLNLQKAYLQLPGCQVNTSTGNCFRIIAYEGITAETVIHVVPDERQS